MSNVGSFGGDLASLATLQAQLATADLRECLRRAAPAIGGLAFLSFLFLAGMSVLAAGFALWVAEAYQLRPAVALMLVGFGGLLVAAFGAWVCARIFSRSLSTFQRSSEELDRNLAWIKTTLTKSER